MNAQTAYDRYGLTGELIYDSAVSKLADGQITVDEAMDYIMQFARGGWSITVDENLESLADELADLNYNAAVVPKGTSDDEIRQKYSDELFITSDGTDFSLSEVPRPFRRGMIIVPNGVDEKRLARAVEKELMTWRKSHRASPVRVQIQRGDL